MHPITTLDLGVLLQRLRDQEAEILALIDEDPRLKKRQRADGLVIANSGPTLFQPELEHQLYAKGIVYSKAPYKLRSIPLIKMFNHGLRPFNDATTHAMEQRDGVTLVFPEKLDGTMIQLFAYDGEVSLTTRSILEGAEGQVNFEYTSLARSILERDHPNLLDASVVDGLSLVFELIHPKTQQVTRYGGRQEVTLLSVYDHAEWRYWTSPEMFEWAERQSVRAPDILVEDQDIERGIERLREMLSTDETFPEGAIVCFEGDGQLLHRVKVKTAEYLEQFAMRYSISLKSVAEEILDRPELHEWKAYLAHLIDQKMSDEEVEAFYREHHDVFLAWHADVRARHERAIGLIEAWRAESGVLPEDPEARRDHLKRAAAWGKTQAGDDFPLFMTSLRQGELPLWRVMWLMPLYSGFRGLLTERFGAS